MHSPFQYLPLWKSYAVYMKRSIYIFSNSHWRMLMMNKSMTRCWRRARKAERQLADTHQNFLIGYFPHIIRKGNTNTKIFSFIKYKMIWMIKWFKSMFISLRNYNTSNNPSKNDKVEDYVSIDSLDAAEHFAKFTLYNWAKALNDYFKIGPVQSILHSTMWLG